MGTCEDCGVQECVEDSIEGCLEYGDPYSGCEGNDSVPSFQCGGGERSHTPEQLSDTSQVSCNSAQL